MDPDPTTTLELMSQKSTRNFKKISFLSALRQLFRLVQFAAQTNVNFLENENFLTNENENVRDWDF